MIKIKNAEEIIRAIEEFDFKYFVESIISSSYYSVEYRKIVFYPLENKRQTICVYFPYVFKGSYCRSDICWLGSNEYEDDLSAEIFGLCLVLASRVARNINNHFDKLIEEEEITEGNRD
jgi:hypothetical protein